jgi:hypothetical protein
MTDADSSPVTPLRDRKRLLTEGMMLAVIPFLGYTYAFVHEAGMNYRFGVPLWLIRLDLSHVLIASAVLLLGWMLLWNFLDLLPNRPWHVLVYLLIEPVMGIGCGLYLLLRNQWHWTLRSVGAAIFPALILYLGIGAFVRHIILPLVRHPDLPSWWDRWRRKMHRSLPSQATTVAGVLIRSDNTDMLLLTNLFLFVAFVIGFAVFALGYRQSHSETDFLLTVDKTPCIVLRRYGESLVCVPVDTVRHQTFGSLRLLPTTDSSRTMRWVTISGLRTPIDTSRAKALW